MQLQSTSDQQDLRRYPPIAVAAPMSMLPEQAASWAYPQPEMTDEQIAYALTTGLLGRLYLSGRLDAMTPQQSELVREGVEAYRQIRADLTATVPIWPLGLPAWDDEWLSLALRAPGVTYLALWQRADPHRLDRPAVSAHGPGASAEHPIWSGGPADNTDRSGGPAGGSDEGTPRPVTLALDHLRGHRIAIDVLYPRRLPTWQCDWQPELGALTVTRSGVEPYGARVLRIVTRPN
jgi:alpha-galactosidase